MKKIFILLFLMALSLVKAEDIDIEKGTLIKLVPCKFIDNKMYACAVVSLNDKIYITLVDNDGIKSIYQVEGDSLLFISGRDMI